MPQILLEYTDNIPVKGNFSALFAELHQVLTETLPTNFAHCKSMCRPQSLFFIGDQNPKNGFVNLTIKVVAGKNKENKDLAAERALNLLDNFFRADQHAMNIKITLEIMDVEYCYFKD